MMEANEDEATREDDEHPLESEEALREPRDIDEDEDADRAPQPGLTPSPSDDD